MVKPKGGLYVAVPPYATAVVIEFIRERAD